MSELRKELQGYLDCLPESKLEALKPILMLLVDDIDKIPICTMVLHMS